MKKLLNWGKGCLIVGFVLLLGGIVFVAVASQIRWARDYEHYDIQVASVEIPTDAASVAYGQHLATTHYCGVCHTGNLSGGYLINQPAMAVIPAPNLTPGLGGVGATNSDEDWVRAIRHGVGHDGRALVGMPAQIWYNLNDKDLGALIAYLKTLPPVDHELPHRTIGPMGRLLLVLGQFPKSEAALIDHNAPRPAAVEPAISAAYGQYLAESACSACHGAQLSGGSIRGQGKDLELAPNLTPGGELAGWSEADFIHTLRMGKKPDGQALSSSMPWYYVGQMTDQELKAVWLYLHSLPALEQNTARTDKN